MKVCLQNCFRTNKELSCFGSINKNIGYTKIIYDNNFWTIEGEADKFENIENFEEKLSKYAKNIELNFIKSENSSLIFQYKIGGILWN